MGAHDGTQLDPLRQAILASSWTGVMVEPVPYVFKRLEERYGDHPRLILENVAIANQDGVREFHHLPQATGPVWKWYDALGSFRRDVVLKHDEFVPGIADQVVTTELPCVTFDTLCSRNGITHLDLIQMDTEGYDLEVLKQIDFPRFAPAIVLYEHLHLNEHERIAAKELMASHGFVQVSDGMDTICLSPRALAIDAVADEWDTALGDLAVFEQ